MPSAMAPGSRRATAWSELRGSLNSRLTRTDRIRAAGATPTMPGATWVPSMPQNGPSGARPEPVKSGPVATSPARSGCRAATPVPSTATVTPAPRVVRHAWVTFRLSSHHSWARTEVPAAGREPPSVAPKAGVDPKTPTLPTTPHTAMTAVSPEANGVRVLRRGRCDTWSDISSEAGRAGPRRWCSDPAPAIVPCCEGSRNAPLKNSLRHRRDRYPRAGRQADPARRVAAVHRDGDQPGAVGVGAEPARRRRAEHVPVGHGQPVTPGPDQHGAAGGDADGRGVRRGDGELDVAEPVHGQHLTLGRAV